MTKLSTSAALAGLLAAMATGPAAADTLIRERAPVLSVVPVYAQVSAPVRECQQVYERQDTVDNYRPGRTVLGAVLGGLAGSTIGKGDGRVVAAAAGAATGAVIGNNWGGRDRNPGQVLVERCNTVDHWRQELVGYDVTYDFHGQSVTSRMNQAPGNWVSLNVRVDIDSLAR